MARVSYRVEGGIAYFPGLAVDRTFETEALPQAQRDALLALFETVRAQRLGPPAPTARRGAADQRSYVIEVRESSGVRRLVVSEFDQDPAAQELVARLRDCADQCEPGEGR
ncbi:protealysin inhibitor emfourin [Kocuria kalidii]|uniref:protealysin inhibitor emfourin n=1 Tax=Kocuria kalidii TaxID=3376283 RepID=UPI0037B88C3D